MSTLCPRCGAVRTPPEREIIARVVSGFLTIDQVSLLAAAITDDSNAGVWSFPPAAHDADPAGLCMTCLVVLAAEAV